MRLSARLSAAALFVGSLVPVAGAASADTGPTQLPLTSFARIVADSAHGHLFLSPGRSGSAVVVTDLNGSQVGSIGSLPGATGLTLSPDGASLWVAEAKGDALARVDTATLAVVQTIALPAGTCPGDVALVGSRLVYGYSCNTYGGSGGYGGLGVADVSTGRVLGTVTSGPFYQPVVASGPSGQVFAADAGLSPTSLYLYDVTGSVTGAVPGLIASRAQICGSLRDLAAKPDGSQVVTACGSPYEHDVYSADKLVSAGVYASGTYPDAAAWSGDGHYVAVGTDSAYDVDVRVYPAGGATPDRSVDFGSTGETLAARGLAVAPDGSVTWAVTTTGTSYALRRIDRVTLPASTLTLAADPPGGYPGATTTLGGQLTSGGSALAGASLAVSRTFGTTTTQLPAQTTASDGTYHFSDTLPATAGQVIYRVDYAGDATHASTTARVVVTVWTTQPSLTLTLSQPSTGSASISGVVLLKYAGTDSPGGVIVHLRRSVSGTSTQLADVVTDSYGGAKFTDTAPAGTVTYTASVDATPVHTAATTSASVGVAGPAPASTTLSAAPSAQSVFVGTVVTVTGTLAATGAIVANAEVSVSRSGCGDSSNAVAVGSALTGSDGRYAVSDNYPPAGTCSYVAHFAGTSSYAAASSAPATVTVQRRATTLTISAAPGSGKNKKIVTVTAHLGTTYTNRSVTITATPSGGATVTLATGTVDANGNLTVTYQPRTTTTYTASFTGDSWYLPATASTTL